MAPQEPPRDDSGRGRDPQELAAGQLFAQGAALAKQKLWSEAEASFIQSGRFFNSSLAWLAAAIACWRQARFSQAATCVEWALHATPVRGTPESAIGVKRFEAQDWVGVEDAFRPLLNQAPVETPTHLFLCIALIQQDRFEEAGHQLMAAWRQELADSDPFLDP